MFHPSRFHEIFSLLLVLRLPCLLIILELQFLPQGHSVLNLRDIGKMRIIGDAQASLAVRVPPLGEVLLEGFGALVREVAADQVETVQLVQPVRDRLAIPAQGQVLRVVRNIITGSSSSSSSDISANL